MAWLGQHYVVDTSPILQAPAELPDYPAAFTDNVLADRDAHLWIAEAPKRPVVPALPMNHTMPSDGVVYDVVDRRGVLIDAGS